MKRAQWHLQACIWSWGAPPEKHLGKTVTWQKRLPAILASSLSTLPWFSRSGMSGMLVAGGGAVSLVVEDAKPSDWDIFLVSFRPEGFCLLVAMLQLTVVLLYGPHVCQRVSTHTVIPRIRSDGSMLTEEERESSGWALVTEIMQGIRRSAAQCPGMSECYTYAGVNKSVSLKLLACPCLVFLQITLARGHAHAKRLVRLNKRACSHVLTKKCYSQSGMSMKMSEQITFCISAAARVSWVFWQHLPIYCCLGTDFEVFSKLYIRHVPRHEFVRKRMRLLNACLRHCANVHQVVHGFDVDCCAVLYDGSEHAPSTQVWAASRALRALHQVRWTPCLLPWASLPVSCSCQGFLLAEPIRQSPSYEFRLEKYSRRLGMQILVPGMHPVLQEHAKMEVQGITKFGVCKVVPKVCHAIVCLTF
eukprot:364362-Chlamydomonas_euryale.AAC.14